MSIMQAAAHIVLSSGIECANTNAIAKRAGVSIGTLYQYYTDKDEIVADLLTEIVEKRQGRIRSALDMKVLTGSVSDSVSRVVDAILDSENEQDSHLEVLLLPLVFRLGSEKKVVATTEAMEGFLKPVLKALMVVSNPKLLKRDLDTVIFVLIHAIRGVFLGLCLPGAKGISKKKLKDELNHLILHYLNYKTGHS